MKRLILVLLSLFASVAFAGSVALTWTAPTTYTDGTALTVAKYNVYRATSAAGLAAAPVLATVTSPAYTDASAPSGTDFYAVTALDAGGLQSVQTNPVSAVVPHANPSPPTGVTVGAITAFDTVKQPGQNVLLAIGTVPNGVKCDTTQGVIVNGATLYAVPASAITYFGNVKPPVAWATCG